MITKIKKNCSQNTIMWLCWAVYTLAYLGRYSYNANISLIMDDFGVTHSEAGLVTTCFFFAYGIGQFLNGFLSKRYNKKTLFTIVLIISSVLNLLVAFGVPFAFIKYIWLVNGLLQSCLWPTLINVISTNLDGKHMNKAILIMSTTASLGTVFAYGFSALFVWIGNYRISFIFGACVMSAIGILWLLIYKPSGVQVKENKTENKEEIKPKENRYLGGISLLFTLLAVFAVADNFIKDGINTWLPTILKEQYFMKDEMSILLTIVLPVLGMFGAIITLNLNKIIKDFIALTTVLFGISAVFIGIITLCSNVNVVVMVLCFGIVLCMTHGVNNVITSIAPLKMRDKVDSGKMAGVLNSFCYLGSTMSSYGLGAITDRVGWQAVFNILLVSCIAAVAIGGLYAVNNTLKAKR